MDNERKEVPASENENWLDEILGTAPSAQEIGPDEQAISSAKLTHPDDLELERILAENWDTEQEPQELPAQQPLTEETQLFTAAEESTPLQAPVADTAIEETPLPKAEEEPAAPSRRTKKLNTTRKGRPKLKKGYGLFGIPHILATGIWLLIILAIGVSLGRVLWVCCADLMAFGKTPQEITITIKDTDDIESISHKLRQAGLIRYPGLFQTFAELTGKYENISVGTFTLSPHLDYNAMINAMGERAPAREEVEIMFPEGYTCAQIFDLLEEKNVCTAAELEAYAATGELDEYWFMEGVTRGDKYCLEGYLFPDTYKFYTNDEPRRVLEKFLDAFDNRYTDLMKSKLEPLNERLASVLASRGYDEAFIEDHKITIREIVIIASMIEKETANDEESYTISSVIYNRLTNPGNYPFLNIDATLIYALNGNIDPVTGERKPLTQADLLMEHPYNTYNNKGLPPGPISNPGRNSLDAALDPVDTSYYYYVYNPHGAEHLFARTEEGHEDNIDYIKSLDD